MNFRVVTKAKNRAPVDFKYFIYLDYGYEDDRFSTPVDFVKILNPIAIFSWAVNFCME
jgi:hypothetical protein